MLAFCSRQAPAFIYMTKHVTQRSFHPYAYEGVLTPEDWSSLSADERRKRFDNALAKLNQAKKRWDERLHREW